MYIFLGKSYFIKKLLSNLSKMRPKQKYLKVIYCCANFRSLNSKDHKFADEIIEACGEIEVEFSSEIPSLKSLEALPTSENAKCLLILDDFGNCCEKSSYH